MPRKNEEAAMPRRVPLLLIGLILLAAGAIAVSAAASPEATGTLVGRTGPGFDISLKTAGGQKVARVKAGSYTFRITDRTGDDAHNFRLVGPGVNRATSVGFVGARTWRVKLQGGKTYRFICDPHAFVMKGSFKVT